MLTKIQRCDCEHPFQDTRYGRGQRVHNTGNKGVSCTVCGKVKAGSDVEKKAVK